MSMPDVSISCTIKQAVIPTAGTVDVLAIQLNFIYNQ